MHGTRAVVDKFRFSFHIYLIRMQYCWPMLINTPHIDRVSEYACGIVIKKYF